MRSVKILFTLGILSLAIICGMFIQANVSPPTVDFTGVILSVATSEDGGTVTLYAEGVFGGDYLFRIDERSRLESLDGKEISIDDLAKGDHVLIEYRKPLFHKEEFHIIKKLKVF